MVITREMEFVAFPEGEPEDQLNSALTLADLRRIAVETADAPADTTVEFERSLFDGRLADILRVHWFEEGPS